MATLTTYEEQNQQALELYDQLRSCTDSFLVKELNFSLNLLDDALRLYGPEKVISSYNGGKDAVVIMHLLRAAVANYTRKRASGIIYRPKLMYFAVENEFPEILKFIDESEAQHGLDIIRYDCGIIKVMHIYIYMI